MLPFHRPPLGLHGFPWTRTRAAACGPEDVVQGLPAGAPHPWRRPWQVAQLGRGQEGDPAAQAP